MSYKNITNNVVEDESKPKEFVCDKCNKCKGKYFIHMDIDNKDKYICSYICSKDMHETYGKKYWDNVVNIEDFQHPRPLFNPLEEREKFSLEYDYVNEDRNQFIEALYEEDERVFYLEQEYKQYSSSDYDSE